MDVQSITMKSAQEAPFLLGNLLVSKAVPKAPRGRQRRNSAPVSLARPSSGGDFCQPFEPCPVLGSCCLSYQLEGLREHVLSPDIAADATPEALEVQALIPTPFVEGSHDFSALDRGSRPLGAVGTSMPFIVPPFSLRPCSNLAHSSENLGVMRKHKIQVGFSLLRLSDADAGVYVSL